MLIIKANEPKYPPSLHCTSFYKNITRDKLNILRKLIFCLFVCFKGDKGDFITVDTYGAKSTTQKKGSSVAFKKMTLKSGELLSSNCLTCLSTIMRTSGLIKQNKKRYCLGSLEIFFRFIDDLTLLNDCSEFERSLP